MMITFPVAEINYSDEKEKFVLTFQFLGYSLSGTGETCSVERRLAVGACGGWSHCSHRYEAESKEC